MDQANSVSHCAFRRSLAVEAQTSSVLKLDLAARIRALWLPQAYQGPGVMAAGGPRETGFLPRIQ